MYIMGTLLRHGSRGAEARYLPKIASRRAAPAGLRRHRARRRLGHDAASRRRADADGDGYVVNGQKIWTSRAEHSDLMLLLARTTPLEEVEKQTDGLSVFLVDMREAAATG